MDKKEKYRELQEVNNHLKIDNDLVVIQKTIIYFGLEILKELGEINTLLKEKPINNPIKKKKTLR